MVQITVTAEVAKLIGNSLEPIELLDQNGHSIGYYTKPFSNAEIAEAKRRSQSPSGGRTTQEVLAQLGNLESP
jgi:hypothetical protein